MKSPSGSVCSCQVRSTKFLASRIQRWMQEQNRVVFPLPFYLPSIPHIWSAFPDQTFLDIQCALKRLEKKGVRYAH